MDGPPVPGKAMLDETYAEWYGKLTDAQRKWVATALEGLPASCKDPEALVREDMSSEYALVARERALKYWDESIEEGKGGSLQGLREVAKDFGGERGAAAVRLMDRMLAVGLTEDEILEFYDWAGFEMQQRFRSLIDEGQDHYLPGFPGWVLMEKVDDKMSDRIVSGGPRFDPGGYALDPWPGEKPQVRPWHSRAFGDEP